MNKPNVQICYPSYSKKALTFTIDDGNIKYDTKFLGILKPYGIRGTFNLCSDRTREFSKEFYVNFYSGYEIANHCKYHPYAFFDGVEYRLSEEKFDENTADPAYIYRVEGRDGFYNVIKPNGWRAAVSTEDYIRYADESLAELNALFGEGSVRDFVWPYGEQDNAEVKAHVKATHRSVRGTGCRLDSTGFAIPADKLEWAYNANHTNLLDAMAKYEAYPDDGELKFFAFGVHSIDYENADKWDDLVEFAKRYGNRPEDFWYAAVGEIFDYEEAAKQIVIKDDGVYNPSSLPIYIIIDGKREVVSPLGVINF